MFFEVMHQIARSDRLKKYLNQILSKYIRLVAAIKSLRFALFPKGNENMVQAFAKYYYEKF